MNLSTERANEWIRHAAAAGVYFLTLVAAYINMGQDMGSTARAFLSSRAA